MGGNVLIVDSDLSFVKGLKYSLEQDGYGIDVASTIKDINEIIDHKTYDMVLLEMELQDGNGLNICQNIRRNSTVPIIFITESDEDIKKILALEYGADDYLIKPFNILELKARMKAIFRRVNYSNNSDLIDTKDFTINTVGRKIDSLEKSVNLTGKEFDLLYVLASEPGRVFTREELLERVWGSDYFGDLRTVDVHIRRIREKIEKDPKNAQYVLTKWGVGYYFKKQKKTI